MTRAIEKLTSGRYKVRYRNNGKQSSQTFDRHTDAKRFADLLRVLGPQGALDQLYDEQLQAQMPSLSQVAEDHIELLTGVEPGTKLTYRRLWDRTWGPLIGQTPANRVTQDDIRRAVNTLAGTYSAKSLQNQRGLLASVCGRAVDQGYLPKNPTKGIRLPRAGEAEREDMRILTPAEFSALISKTHAHYQPLVRFLVGVGARWGEAVALTVSDLSPVIVEDPRTGTVERRLDVRIRKAMKWSPDNKRRIGPTKTRRGNRTVRLPRHVQAELEMLCVGKAPTDLVFTAPKGGPVHHRTFWSDIWLPAVRDLVPRPRIHDLRHTYASWQLAHGTPIHVVQRNLGHESIKTTVDVYGGLLPDAQIAAAAAADAVFGELN